jgi:hypothetical protein
MGCGVNERMEGLRGTVPLVRSSVTGDMTDEDGEGGHPDDPLAGGGLRAWRG